MITGELKNKIDSLWDTFWTGGITNPLTVVEQITYLMFIHDLDDRVNAKAASMMMVGNDYDSIFKGTFKIENQDVDKNQFRWSVFKDLPPQKMYDIVSKGVFPFIKQLHPDKESAYAKYMNEAVLVIEAPQKLAQIVDALDKIYASMKSTRDKDIRGDVYEYVLSKIQTSGINGQFRTPRHIIKMMVDLTRPTPDDTICDPAFGTAGFLVAASEYLEEHHHNEIFFNEIRKNHYNNHMFTGFDTEPTMLRIGAMNMMVHKVENPHIESMDSLSINNTIDNKFSLILANPPFKGSLDADMISPDLLKVTSTTKTELLFIALFIRMLKVGGRAAVIVPEGVLFGSSKAHVSIRKELVEKHDLQAVISMPSGVFKPYAGVSTAVLIFTKTGNGGTNNVWFYDMKADGFSLNDKRSSVEEDDIPDIIKKFNNLSNEVSNKRTDKSFLVSKKEIIDNEYNLSISKYGKSVQIQQKYCPTKDIIADIRKLEEEIEKSLNELEGII